MSQINYTYFLFRDRINSPISVTAGFSVKIIQQMGRAVKFPIIYYL